MNKIIILIAVVLIIVSFFVGYFINKSNAVSIDIQNQINSLQQQNNNLTLQIEELQNEKTNWENAVKIIYSGQVESVSTSHGGKLTLHLKNDSSIHDVQMPSYVSIRDILDRCGDKCKDVIEAVE